MAAAEVLIDDVPDVHLGEAIGDAFAPNFDPKSDPASAPVNAPQRYPRRRCQTPNRLGNPKLWEETLCPDSGYGSRSLDVGGDEESRPAPDRHIDAAQRCRAWLQAKH